MTGPDWRFGVLGTLTLEHKGVGVDLRGRRPRTLLALLLMSRGQPLSADRLTHELWGDDMPASAQSALHVHLSKVRILLGDLLERTDAGYALRAGTYELDANVFNELLDQAEHDPDRALALSAAALQLWRGEPLSDLQPEGALADWRRTLEERRLGAVIDRIDAQLREGAAAELVVELQQLSNHHPYEERLWGQLMLALYRTGRQAEALDVYQRARRRLADELGLDPGQPLRHLHERILNQDPSLLPGALDPSAHPDASGPSEATGARPTSPGASGPVIALPQPSTRLIGRDGALLELESMVADPFCRLVTLTGPGGVGKTRLAIAHASRWGDAFEDGVVFVGLARLTDASQVRAEIAAAIARRSDATEPNEVTLIRYLKERRLLLVLDNFEHVLDARAVVAELLTEVPGLKALVTSRVPLQVRGEQRFEVEPLASDAHGDPTGGPAVEMFVQSARALNRKFDTAPSELATVAAICTALDGLPLAIELAAARSSTLSPSRIAAQLDAPLTIGRGELRDLPERHQTVEAAIRWSYDLLSVPAQAALRAASVFTGPFTPEGLGAVTGHDVTDALDELVLASLVSRSSVRERFRLLDLVRSFALSHLIEAGEGDGARARHGRYLATRFADVAAVMSPSNPGEVALEMAPDHADIRVAVAAAIAAGDSDLAVTLARTLQPLWMASLLAEESAIIVDSILDAFTIDPDEELNLLRMAGFANGYRETAPYWQRRRASRARELGRPQPQVAALSNLLGPALDRRDPDEINAISAEILAVLASSADITLTARSEAMSNLAEAAYVLGDTVTALERSAEGLTLAEAGGHPHPLTKAREMHLSLSSAHQGWIPPGPLQELVEGALGLQLPDIMIITLWACTRYALSFDRDLARTWAAGAERAQIELGAESWQISWRTESLTILDIDDSAALLAGVAARPPHELLTEARDWLALRDPEERASRAVLATP